MARRSSAYVVEVEPSGTRWLKSSASGNVEQACVEVALTYDLVLVRDSQDRSGPRLAFPAPRWAAFLGLLRAR